MADFLQRKQELVNAVRELDDGKVLQLAEEALRLGVEPLVLLEAVNEECWQSVSCMKTKHILLLI